MKHLPNILSVLRIALSPVLVATADSSAVLATLMLLSGFTDAADGLIARRFGCRTALGARLDSVADWVFFLAVGWVFCTRYTAVVRACLTELMIVVGVRIVAVGVGVVRFGRVVSIHTLGNKLSYALAFLLLVRIVLRGPVPTAVMRTVLFIAALAALEELLILLRSRTPDPDRRSIFDRSEN